MYDIFYVSKIEGNDQDWEKIKNQYPTAQRLKNIHSMDQISSRAFTKMFWVIWDDLDLDFSFNLKEYHATKWDDEFIHVFLNGKKFDGICLFPKNRKISQQEFDTRFFESRKDIDIIASQPKKHKIYQPHTYEEYSSITDEVFWLVWPEVVIINDDIHNLTNELLRTETHAFKNLCNEKESYVNGILLCTQNKKLSKREFDKRYAIDKKEHNVVASRYRYPVYNIKNYQEYIDILSREKHSMFWCIWPELEVIDESIFDFYFDPFDGLYDYDRKINHVFKNSFNDQQIYVNGLVLFSKENVITKKEFDHRFLIEKKCHDRLVTQHRFYDVVFISYDEINADDNYKKLLQICPRAKRVHNIKGIHNAHKHAASLCDTEMFWVVDGDAIVEDDFNFDLVMSSYDIDCVHVWKSRNPINNLEYGNGGIKLLPRILTLEMDLNSHDMTTSISKKFKSMNKVSNSNAFNVDEFSTWRSAFRECCKLSSRIIERQHEEETQQRLDIWCTVGLDKPFGSFSIKGANAGRSYGLENKHNQDALKKINDFEWLRNKFQENE